jgi:hypothetical protein
VSDFVETETQFFARLLLAIHPSPLDSDRQRLLMMVGPASEAEQAAPPDRLRDAAREVCALFGGDVGQWTLDGREVTFDAASALLSLNDYCNDVMAAEQAAAEAAGPEPGLAAPSVADEPTRFGPGPGDPGTSRPTHMGRGY